MSHAIHDFSGKLRQPSVLPTVQAYVNWRRAVRKARAEGAAEPELPPEQAPISINLDLTTACNYRCDHCIDWDILNSRFKHEEKDLEDSLTRMAERGRRNTFSTLRPRISAWTNIPTGTGRASMPFMIASRCRGWGMRPPCRSR